MINSFYEYEYELGNFDLLLQIVACPLPLLAAFISFFLSSILHSERILPKTTFSKCFIIIIYLLFCYYCSYINSNYYFQELDKLVKSAEERKRQLEKQHSALQLVLEGLHPEKTLAQESRSESASTISAVDDNDYGTLSSSASSSSSLTFSDNTSCLDFGSKLSVSSSNSSLVSSPVQPYPPFDPYLNGLLPALPLCYPRISMYPYLDVQPLWLCDTVSVSFAVVKFQRKVS